MSAIDRLRGLPALFRRRTSLLLLAPIIGVGSVALGAVVSGPDDAKVTGLLKARLPKTEVTKVDCKKIEGICEITAGSNLFYVNPGARYLIIGRVYDMETRQDLTAARLLEINPDMLVGGAAKANAAAAEGPDEAATEVASAPVGARRTTVPVRPAALSLAGLPSDGAIVWGNRAARQTVTVFTDFRCGYCRALTNVLRDMDVRVVERPISVLGSRDIADRVYCSKNQEQALHAAYAGEPFKAPSACDTKGLDANEKFARAHGLSGTPVIVRSDGAMIEGYRPREFLEAWLNGAKS
ncbi:disulfide bond formation protein DsbC (plasmid) [Sphingomonas panacis]|uniref:Thiol:disulfide interchange protein n=1 Tax=Sphingomonas panacis TaxID=1560345 RepID=A0A1B3ZIJ5_9SPHN|nr:DsbC family protein [Sphingomonas panacis]AOH87252.1 disulfide bond formation protein DsbC [Sphingomonas panacis]